MATKSPERILPVVTDGDWQWDDTRGDFATTSAAVPPALRGVFAQEPLFLDLRWAHDDRQLSLQHARFRDAIAQLAAPMHGVSKDDLEGEDVRQHRRVRQVRTLAISALLLFAFTALLTGLFAIRNAHRYTSAAQEAQHQQQLATQQQGSAERSAAEAARQQASAEYQKHRARDAAKETRRQEQLARQQERLADQATAEATRQQRNAQRQRQLANQADIQARKKQRQADLATVEAVKQKKIATREQELAAIATADALKQQKIAKEQRRIAIGRRLVNQAKSTVNSNPQTALMLGIAATSIQVDTEARSELTGLMTSTHFAGALRGGRGNLYGPHDLMAACRTEDPASLWQVVPQQKPVKLADFGKTCAGIFGFNRDGHILAVLNSDNSVDLWNLTDPRRPRLITTLHTASTITLMALDPTGHTLVTYDTENVDFWDVSQRGEPPRHLAARNVADISLSTITFSPNGQVLALNNWMDGQILLWGVADPHQPTDASVLETTPSWPTFSPDGNTLAVGDDDGVVTFWDVTNPRQPQRGTTLSGDPGDQLRSVVFSHDGRTVAAGAQRGALTVWQLAAPTKPLRIDTGHNSPLWGIAFSEDNQRIIVDGMPNVTMWTVTDPRGAPRPVLPLTGDLRQPVALAYASDGRSITTVDPFGRIGAWHIAAPDGPRWEAGGRIRGSSELSLSQDGLTLSIQDNNGLIQRWDLTDRSHPRVVSTIRGFTGVMSMAFSPDGSLLAVNNAGKTVALWDVHHTAKPVKLADLTGHTSWVGALAFSPDGHTLATGGMDSTVMLWDLSNRHQPRRLSAITAHSGWIGAVSFSSDGRTLATASSDRTAMLWDIADPLWPIRIATFTATDLETSAIAFSPDGHTLADGGAHDQNLDSVTVWDFTELNALRADPTGQACISAGRGLSREEWNRYVPELPYRPTCAADPR